jgi:RNA polymerase sigma-70 factor (ECF subfamily)
MSDRPSRPPDYQHERSVLLLEHARAGDEQALEVLLARYLPQLRRWASGRLPARARSLFDTGDLVQDAMLRTIRKVRDFVPEHDGAFMAYLRQAVLNRIRDEARRMVRRPDDAELGSYHLDPGPSPLENAIGAQALERYESALARLRDTERQAVILRLEMGLSYDEIAQAIGKTSANTARMTVNRALARMAQDMAEEAPSER